MTTIKTYGGVIIANPGWEFIRFLKDMEEMDEGSDLLDATGFTWQDLWDRLYNEEPFSDDEMEAMMLYFEIPENNEDEFLYGDRRTRHGIAV